MGRQIEERRVRIQRLRKMIDSWGKEWNGRIPLDLLIGEYCLARGCTVRPWKAREYLDLLDKAGSIMMDGKTIIVDKYLEDKTNYDNKSKSVFKQPVADKTQQTIKVTS